MRARGAAAGGVVRRLASSRSSPSRLNTTSIRCCARSPFSLGEESVRFLPGSCRHGGVRRPFIRVPLTAEHVGDPGHRGGPGNDQLRQRQRTRHRSSGAVVAGAQVTARQTDTNIVERAVTDPEGRFRFPYLRVGPYEITVRHAGFADATRRLTLTVGSAFDLPIVLPLEAVAETVTVTGRPRCSRRRAARSPARSRRPKSRTCR